MINKINQQKTILDQYYTGPPKYESQVNEFEFERRPSSVSKRDYALNDESAGMLNLISDSGNEKSSEIMNMKQKIDTQDRIDLTNQKKENPESSVKLPFFKPPTSAGPVFKVPVINADSQGTKLAS